MDQVTSIPSPFPSSASISGLVHCVGHSCGREHPYPSSPSSGSSGQPRSQEGGGGGRASGQFREGTCTGLGRSFTLPPLAPGEHRVGHPINRLERARPGAGNQRTAILFGDTWLEQGCQQRESYHCHPDSIPGVHTGSRCLDPLRGAGGSLRGRSVTPPHLGQWYCRQAPRQQWCRCPEPSGPGTGRFLLLGRRETRPRGRGREQRQKNRGQQRMEGKGTSCRINFFPHPKPGDRQGLR